MLLGQTDSSNAERFEHPNSKLQNSNKLQFPILDQPGHAQDNPCSSEREQADSPVPVLFAVN